MDAHWKRYASLLTFLLCSLFTPFQYILPLLTVLMELMMDIHHLSLSRAIDFKEWLVPYTGFLSVRQAADRHVELLKGEFKFVQTLLVPNLIGYACRWQSVLRTTATGVWITVCRQIMLLNHTQVLKR